VIAINAIHHTNTTAALVGPSPKSKNALFTAPSHRNNNNLSRTSGGCGGGASLFFLPTTGE